MKRMTFFQTSLAYSRQVGRRITVVDDPDHPGYSIHSMSGNFVRVSTKGIGSAGNVSIAADCLLSRDKSLGLCGIVLKCNLTGACGINGKNLFTLFVDGTKIVPESLESSYVTQDVSIVGEKHTVEVMRCQVHKETIAQLGNASDVGFEIRGKYRKIEGRLTQKNVARFRYFYETCLEDMKPIDEFAASSEATQ